MTASPSSLLPSQTLETTNLFSISLWIFLFWILYINEILRYVVFCVWLYSFGSSSPSGYNSSLVNCFEIQLPFPSPPRPPRHAPMLFASYSLCSQGSEIATPLELLRDTALTDLCLYLFWVWPGPPGELKEQQITLKLL